MKSFLKIALVFICTSFACILHAADESYEASFQKIEAYYEKGDYKLKTDSCLETQTYSRQPSKLTGITVHYAYQIKNDTLTFNGILPNGTTVMEYWKRVK